MSALARLLPHPKLHEIDRVAVAAEPEAAWRAMRELDFYDVPFVRALFAARVVPDQLSHWLHPSTSAPVPMSRSMTIDDIATKSDAFRILADVPFTEIVLGAVGKVWKPRIPFVKNVNASLFTSFADPGYAKVAWNVEVAPRAGGGSWITVEVRVTTTDDESWRAFGRYWLLIGRFSRLIRKSVLRQIARRLGRPHGLSRDQVRSLAGDDLIPDATASWTNAVTIDAPPRDVWPWLVQMGCRRAGWYSIDALDNAGVRSADHVIPELQHVKVGDVLPATPKDPPGEGFAILRLDPERSLVLGSPDLLPEELRLAAGAKAWPGPYRATWSFTLDPVGDDATRLVVRVRGAFQETSPRNVLLELALRPEHAIMEAVQLRNLKRRAEAAHAHS